MPEPAPAPSGTHDVAIGTDAVVKTYRQRARREPEREWATLRLLARHAPDLAPAPLGARLDGVPPTVRMSRLPGRPLRGTTVDADTALGRLVEAIATLHAAVPVAELAGLQPASYLPARAVEMARTWSATAPAFGARPPVRSAYAAAVDWLAATDLDALIHEPVDPVLGIADGNLANYLDDGMRVRIVDFENAGRSDRAFELADLVEHPSAWVDGSLDVDGFLAGCGITDRERPRLLAFRRLGAFFWLVHLRPGGPAERRNPPGTLERQAERVLALL